MGFPGFYTQDSGSFSSELAMSFQVAAAREYFSMLTWFERDPRSAPDDLMHNGIEALYSLPGPLGQLISELFFDLLARGEARACDPDIVAAEPAEDYLASQAMVGNRLAGCSLRLLAEYGHQRAASTIEHVYCRYAALSTADDGSKSIAQIWQAGVSGWPYPTAIEEGWQLSAEQAPSMPADEDLQEVLALWSSARRDDISHRVKLSTALLTILSATFDVPAIHLLERGAMPAALGSSVKEAFRCLKWAACSQPKYVDLLRQLAAAGWISANITLGEILPVEAAIERLKLAAAAGSPMAQVRLAERYKELEEHLKARAWFCRAAEQGYPDGMRLLAMDLIHRSEDEAELRFALDLALRAKAQGAPRSSLVAAYAILKINKISTTPIIEPDLGELLYFAVAEDRSEDALGVLQTLSEQGDVNAKSKLEQLLALGCISQA